MMNNRWGIILVVMLQANVFGQTVDTLRINTDSLWQVKENIEFLYQLLTEQTKESLIEDQGLTEESAEATHEDLLEEYLFYQSNPVNINSDEVVRLEEMGLLNVFQIEALQNYRRQYGDLLFIDELLMMDEFSEATVTVIGPLVIFGKSEKAMELERPGLGKMLTHGRHQITLNYAQKFDDSEVYDEVPDSLLLAKKNAYYLGGPMKLQVKYAYHYKQRLRFGFALEKDAGEPFFFGKFSDTIHEIVKQYRSPGFDFYGAHLYMTDIRLTRFPESKPSRRLLTIKDLALGDYLLSFGQGLTLWSGMSFGKASEGSSPIKRAAGIRPKASASEGKYFRGAATTLKYGDWYATAFYSFRNIDATVMESDTTNDDFDDPMLISALQETGYHRTLGELEKRNTLRQQVFGGHLCYAGPQLELGLTAYHLRLGAPLQLKPSKYNQFFFQGDRLTDLGLDFRWLCKKTVFFGELARSDNGAFAGLVGMTVKPRGYINFSLLYRNYDKGYHSLFSSAFGETSRHQGEEGYYLGLQCSPAPGWEFLAYGDFFRLTWLTSQVYNPSWGEEYSLKIQRKINQNASMQLKLKSKTKMKNSMDDHSYSYYPIFYTKRSVQFLFSYTLYDDWIFGNKASYSHYFNDDCEDSRGYFICQDVAFKPADKPYSLTLRYALFDSDDYNSRVSMYENDVLGAFSIPSLYGHGSRLYLLGKVKLFGCLSLYSRLGFTFFQDETKTDLKFEMIWKG